MEALRNVLNQSQEGTVFSATQFASALCAHVLRNQARRKKLVSTFKSLEANLSAGRKLFRLGNAIEAGEAARRGAGVSPTRALRLCVTAANVNRALYLLCDNALWAAGAGLLPDLDRGRWGAGAWRFQLLALLLSLTRDAYLLLLLRGFRCRPAALLDAVKNACDLPLPLDKLGIYRWDPGALAFCGLLSSLIGIVTLVRPQLRLKA